MSARRHDLATGLGLAGAVLGVAAGITQATVGDVIPEWTGDKQAPVALGLLTVALSLVAALAAGLQHRTARSAGARAACATGLVVPGLLCLSTVGRLWYVPAVLLIAAGAMTIDSRRGTATAVAAGWWRILLGALGCCVLLMAAGAAPATTAAGAVGGICLLAAAWWRRAVWTLVALGTIPFAALAWTSVVPLLLTVEAFAVAAVITRTGHLRSTSS